MYHPDTMLYIAHRREAELIREAEACGIPRRAEGDRRTLSKRVLSTAIAFVTFIVALSQLIGQWLR
jgi:hypothetical protein